MFFSNASYSFLEMQPSNSSDGSAVKAEGRMIYYRVSNENKGVDDATEELSFALKGSGVEELKQKLKEETGLDDIVVCSRNPLNGKLYPLRLHLPPNNANMHVVVVPSSSEGWFSIWNFTFSSFSVLSSLVT